MQHFRILRIQGLVLGLLASSTSAFAGGLQSFIVGGTEVNAISKVPFIVQLHDELGVECGGTVIAPTWVLSAGHCAEVVQGITLLGGSIISGSGTALAIKNHFVHPKFAETSNGVSYDFMLIQLAQPIDFTKGDIKAIALPDADFLSRGLQDPGQLTTVAGWGDLRENAGDYPSILNEVQVPLVSNEVANAPDAYSGALDESSIAAGLVEGGKDSCDGDSGGPLFVFDAVKNQNVLVGAVSWGQGCAEPHKYGVYSRVSAATDWINQTMAANH